MNKDQEGATEWREANKRVSGQVYCGGLYHIKAEQFALLTRKISDRLKHSWMLASKVYGCVLQAKYMVVQSIWLCSLKLCAEAG